MEEEAIHASGRESTNAKCRLRVTWSAGNVYIYIVHAEHFCSRPWNRHCKGFSRDLLTQTSSQCPGVSPILPVGEERRGDLLDDANMICSARCSFPSGILLQLERGWLIASRDFYRVRFLKYTGMWQFCWRCSSLLRLLAAARKMASFRNQLSLIIRGYHVWRGWLVQLWPKSPFKAARVTVCHPCSSVFASGIPWVLGIV